MEFKGTKGKWYVKNIDNPLYGKYESLEINISSDRLSSLTTVWSYSQEDEEAKANALLISKAPEMLEILIELYNDKETWSNIFESQRIKIEQLIKEATEI